MANLKFTSTGSTTVTLSGNGLSNSFFANNSAYTIGTAINLADGEIVEFYGTGEDFSKDGSHYYQFVIGGTGTVKVEGDLVSLINNNQYVKQYQFINLFKGCSKITDISDLVFPNSIAEFCYSNMFAGCTGLIDASTTLPATALARWCYNGMFAGCTSLTEPPTINATTIAPFSYYSMFYGCSSLKDAPAIITKTMNSEFACNGMFRNCSSLSSVTVSINNWSTSENENKNWLYGVAGTGVFNYPNTLASIPAGVKPEGWTAVQVYPSIINVASQTFSFDAMSDTSQTKELSYSYNGEETVSIQVDTTNKPSWLSYTTDNDSVNFVANGYAIDSSTSFEIPITLSAADAETKSVVATFNISNYPIYTITFDTIPAINWDFNNATTSSVNLLQYINYEGNTLSTEIVGTLPEGVIYEGGVLSANKELMSEDVTTTLTLKASASDARTATSGFGLNIEGVYIDYSTMPLTFKAVDGPANVRIYNTSYKIDKPTVSYSTDNGTTWSSYNSIWGQYVELAQGQTVMFSAVVASGFNYWGGDPSYYNGFALSGGKIECYGNIMSIQNYDTYPWQNGFAALFSGITSSNCSLYAHNLILPSGAIHGGTYAWMFKNCTALKTAPVIRSLNGTSDLFIEMFYGATNISSVIINTLTGLTVSNLFNNTFTNCNNLSSIEVHFTEWPRWSVDWVDGVASQGQFHCPAALGTSANISRGSYYCPTYWTVINDIQ